MKWPKKLDEIETYHLLSRRPRGRFPRALCVHLRWAWWVMLSAEFGLVASLTLLCLAVSGVPWFSVRISSGLATHLPLWIFFSSIFIVRAVVRRSARRFGQKVRENDFMNCLECGYNLRGLPDDHYCPECGAEYFLPDVQIKWRDFLGDV